jgi:hypothetical protein
MITHNYPPTVFLRLSTRLYNCCEPQEPKGGGVGQACQPMCSLRHTLKKSWGTYPVDIETGQPGGAGLDAPSCYQLAAGTRPSVSGCIAVRAGVA